MLADGEVAAYATSIIDGRVLHLLDDDRPLCSTPGRLSLITAETAARPWYKRRALPRGAPARYPDGEGLLAL
jgi:hypothetical protein